MGLEVKVLKAARATAFAAKLKQEMDRIGKVLEVAATEGELEVVVHQGHPGDEMYEAVLASLKNAGFKVKKVRVGSEIFTDKRLVVRL